MKFKEYLSEDMFSDISDEQLYNIFNKIIIDNKIKVGERVFVVASPKLKFIVWNVSDSGNIKGTLHFGKLVSTKADWTFEPYHFRNKDKKIISDSDYIIMPLDKIKKLKPFRL